LNYDKRRQDEILTRQDKRRKENEETMATDDSIAIPMQRSRTSRTGEGSRRRMEERKWNGMIQ